MHLESARDLKLEVVDTILDQFSMENARRLRPSRGARAQVEAAGSVGERDHKSIAIGIARDTHEFKLAIRIQRRALLQSTVLEKIIEKAKGEVDIKLIGNVRKRIPISRRRPARAMAVQAWNRGDLRPMLIGGSIGHPGVTAGTIGAFVRDGKEVCILSNNHVLANENMAQAGDVILQRARSDGGRSPAQNSGTLKRWIPLVVRPARNFVDAAIAAVDAAAIYPTLLRGGGSDASDQHLRGLAAVQGAESVFKLGRTTGKTQGRVTAIELDDVVVGYGIGRLRFNNIIEIESLGPATFCQGGDSGSLIVNEHMEGVALLFAGSDLGGHNGLGVTYANPLVDVLEQLKVELITL